MTSETRFTHAFAYLLSAMIVWMVFFMGSYGLVATICAIRLPPPILGMLPAQLGLGAATLIALAVTSCLIVRAWRHKAVANDWRAGFTASLVILQGVIALMAIGWNFLPLAFLAGCGLQDQMGL